MAKTATDNLTDIERDAMVTFAQNPVAVEAFKKVLCDQILFQGVQNKGETSEQNRNWVFGIDQSGQMPDAEFGRKVRTYADALVIVERAFKAVIDLVPADKKGEGKNPAR